MINIFFNVERMYFLDDPQNFIDAVALTEFSGIPHIENFRIFNLNRNIVIKLQFFDDIDQPFIFKTINAVFPKKMIWIRYFGYRCFSSLQIYFLIWFQ